MIYIDVAICVALLAAVVIIGVVASRKTGAGAESSEDYFLAGRGLKWWLIGFSLIAANISAEQFVGMSGQAARGSIGLAVASYEWIAAVTLVIVAFFFLPTFLRSGIFTIPEFLEYRFNHAARLTMSLWTVIIYVGVNIATVIYLGAKALDPLFTKEMFGIELGIVQLTWIVGLLAAVYVAVGGLKACAWADLLQGSALIVGGLIIMFLAFQALGDPEKFSGTEPAVMAERLDVAPNASIGEKFAVLKERHMHMVLPAANDFLPWTALLFGIWIPNLYYWGLNQYIMQRALGSQSLAQGQIGTVFAASLKLLIPFMVCIPGIIAFTLYSDKMRDNAMNSPQLNKPILEAYETARDNPEQGQLLFPFDIDFATLHLDQAREIAAYNARVAGGDEAGLDSLEAEALVKANDAAVSKAAAKTPALRKQQSLVGYDYDSAFPMLIRYLTPKGGLLGFVLFALMGAVISTLASLFNAASTIFTMDIYRELINRKASQRNLIWVGRLCIPVCVVIGCLIAPQLGAPQFRGAFAFIQEFQGYLSPGVLTIFLFGLFVPRAPRMCGVLGLTLSPAIYGYLHLFHGDMAFLNRMAITVVALVAVIALVTLVRPLREPIRLPQQTKLDLRSSRGAKFFGILVVIATAALYLYFW